MSLDTKLLIVEDEAPIREGLADRLQREGFRVTQAASLAAGLEALQGNPDLVVLDRRLPDGEGLDLLQSLRSDGRRTPVIVLSARGMAEDRIDGLEGGADDYVTKPFHVRELVARVKAVLARAESGTEPEGSRWAFGDCELDVGARLLRREGDEVELTKLEFDLLQYFLRNPGRAIPRNELLDRVWGYDHYPTTRTVDFHVVALRRKIGDGTGTPKHLKTVHGVGYRFES